jgi:hypothetical protein
MTRFFGLMAATLAMIAVSTAARASTAFDIKVLQTALSIEALSSRGLDWHVGDKASYSMDVGGFIKGTSNNFVREDTGKDFWMENDMDLQGPHKIEIMINKSNGQIDKLLMDGQEQSVPKEDTEVLEMHNDKVTVAAGSFDCTYAKIRDKKTQKITEAWINPKVVPMTGMLKMSADSQFGKISQEATSFSFAPHSTP